MICYIDTVEEPCRLVSKILYAQEISLVRRLNLRENNSFLDIFGEAGLESDAHFQVMKSLTKRSYPANVRDD